MPRYIDADALLAEAKRLSGPQTGDGWDNWGVYALIERQPTADVVEVRHGRWTWDGGEDMHYYCSLCHHNAYGNTGEVLDGEYKYCPSCGARMDGGQDDGSELELPEVEHD